MRRTPGYITDRQGCTRRDPGPTLAAFAAVVTGLALLGLLWGIRAWADEPVWQPLQPVRERAYGPNLHSDATGQPFEYQYQLQPVPLKHAVIPFSPIHRDAYGPELDSDATGAPIQAVPLR